MYSINDEQLGRLVRLSSSFQTGVDVESCMVVDQDSGLILLL